MVRGECLPRIPIFKILDQQKLRCVMRLPIVRADLSGAGSKLFVRSDSEDIAALGTLITVFSLVWQVSD
jgi:hypothetical protein